MKESILKDPRISIYFYGIYCATLETTHNEMKLRMNIFILALILFTDDVYLVRLLIIIVVQIISHIVLIK